MDKDDLRIIEELHDEFENGNQSFYNFSSILTGCQYLGLYRLCKRYLSADQKILDWGGGEWSFFLLLIRSGV